MLLDRFALPASSRWCFVATRFMLSTGMWLIAGALGCISADGESAHARVIRFDQWQRT